MSNKGPRHEMHVTIQGPRDEVIHTKVTIWASNEVHAAIHEMIPALCSRVWRTYIKGIGGTLASYLHDPRYDLEDTIKALRDQATKVVIKELVYQNPSEVWIVKWAKDG